MTLARYTKALVPAVGSILAVLYGWANTGHWDVPTLRLAVVGLVYAFLVYLLPNLPMPAPEPAPLVPGFTVSNVQFHPAPDAPPDGDGEAMRDNSGASGLGYVRPPGTSL